MDIIIASVLEMVEMDVLSMWVACIQPDSDQSQSD